MSYEDQKRASWQQWELDGTEEESRAQPLVSPGKRTLTMSLPPRPASSLASVQAPVQHKADPAAVMQRKEQAALTDRWMDVALRPDLHDAPVQPKSARQASDQISPELPASGGQPMPGDVQTKMERAFAADFSAVRIHEGPQATSMGALAYTQGTDIHFAPGQYSPGSQRGQALLGHELAHVVQQRQGRVQATSQAKGVAINANSGLEREADEMGARAARGERMAHPEASGAASASSPTLSIIQRQEDPGANYEDGNRPDPTTSNDHTFELRSSGDRVLRQGERVTYTLEQVSPTIGSPYSSNTIAWEVINDPQAVATGDVDARLEGPANQRSWSLQAARPGVHIIRARIEHGELSSEVEYSQTVVSNDRAYAIIPSSVAPSPLTTIEDFIAMVARIEAVYSGMAWQDVASKIRKEYYPGVGGRYGGLRAAFTWDDLIDEQQDMPPLQAPPVAAADIAALRSTQVVSTAGGNVDIGHVLTGVDSMNFPRVAGIFDRHDTSGPAAATWSGDVGSALVHYANEASHNDDSDATRELYYNRFASASDMAGDYDGIAIADMSGVSAATPLSERLRQYYVTSVSQGVNRRFHNFCAVSGFEITNGRLGAAARDYIGTQIHNFARAFNIRGSLTDAMILSSPRASLHSMEHTTIQRISDNLDWYVDHFIAEIEAGLAAE